MPPPAAGAAAAAEQLSSSSRFIMGRCCCVDDTLQPCDSGGSWASSSSQADWSPCAAAAAACDESEGVSSPPPPPPPPSSYAAPPLPPPSMRAFAKGEDVLVRNVEPQVAAPLRSAAHGTLPFNEPLRPVEIDTPLFRGRLLLLVRGLPSTPPGVFDGRRRQMWLVVQGTFKRDVAFDDLTLGSVFDQPLRLPASAAVARAAAWLVGRLGGGARLDLGGGGGPASVSAPLAAAAQVVNVADVDGAGGDDDMAAWPAMLSAEEDMTAYDPSLVASALTGSWTWGGGGGGANKAAGGGPKARPMPAARRRQLFATAAGRAGRGFGAGARRVWTFHVYDSALDWARMELPVPLLFRVDMAAVLDGQPLRVLLRDARSGAHAAAVEVWHRRTAAAAAARLGGARSSGGGGGGCGFGSDDDDDNEE